MSFFFSFGPSDRISNGNRLSQVVLGHGLGNMGGMEPRHFHDFQSFSILHVLLFFLFL